MKINDLVRSDETKIISGRVYSYSDLKNIGDIIFTNKRLLLQFGDDIRIYDYTRFDYICLSIKADYERIAFGFNGSDAESIYFAANAEWKAWSEEVFRVLSNNTMNS